MIFFSRSPLSVHQRPTVEIKDAEVNLEHVSWRIGIGASGASMELAIDSSCLAHDTGSQQFSRALTWESSAWRIAFCKQFRKLGQNVEAMPMMYFLLS